MSKSKDETVSRKDCENFAAFLKGFATFGLEDGSGLLLLETIQPCSSQSQQTTTEGDSQSFDWNLLDITGAP